MLAGQSCDPGSSDIEHLGSQAVLDASVVDSVVVFMSFAHVEGRSSSLIVGATFRPFVRCRSKFRVPFSFRHGSVTWLGGRFGRPCRCSGPGRSQYFQDPKLRRVMTTP